MNTLTFCNPLLQWLSTPRFACNFFLVLGGFTKILCHVFFCFYHYILYCLYYTLPMKIYTNKNDFVVGGEQSRSLCNAFTFVFPNTWF